MNNIGDLELNIMSCLLLKPELMETMVLEDKHFVKHQRLWLFIKSCYKKFGTLDIHLMFNICKDKYKILDYLMLLLDLEVTSVNFKKYEKQLIEQYNEDITTKVKIDMIYKSANDLWTRNITLDQFKNRINEIMEG